MFSDFKASALSLATFSILSKFVVASLSIPAVAFFLYDEAAGKFRLQKAVGVRDRSGHLLASGDSLDLSFLVQKPEGPYLFMERTRHFIDVKSRDWPQSVRQTIADLDLTYYVPCIVRGRTIAYIGVSRTDKGDFLSSDDVDLLVALAGSVGIAIENSRLYHSLARKVQENERLKEFSENIVESISVGILAADLDDRVESWNSQMERLTGIARDAAVGHRLDELFPAALAEQLPEELRAMLPALPDVGAAFRIDNPNRVQTVLSVFLTGFGLGQFAMGPLSDRYGRRRPLIIGSGVAVLAGIDPNSASCRASTARRSLSAAASSALR